MEIVINRLLALPPQPDALIPLQQALSGQPLTLRTLLAAGPLIEQYETTLEHQQWLSQEVSRRCQTLAPIPLPFIPLGF